MIYFLTVLTILVRLLPHAPNFAPLGALALWAGLTGDRRKIWLPLTAVFATDLVLGFYPGFVWVYLSYGLLFATGYQARRTSGTTRHFSLPLAGSVLFYLVSNFGVWVSGGLYPATAAGLGQCYAAALPFFRYTAASDLLYFNAFALVTVLAARWWPVRPVFHRA